MNCREMQAAVDSAHLRSELANDVELHLGSCEGCGRYATGNFQLLGLLAAQPRVEAPPDFDFRLRARIARARDERRGMAWSFREFWTHTFSWREAATTLALLTVVATSATLYLSRGSVQTSQSPLVTSASPEANVSVQPVAPLAGSDLATKGSASTARDVAPRPAAVRSSASGERVVAIAAAPVEMNGAQEILIYRPGHSGLPGTSHSVILPRRGQVTWGAQLVSVQHTGSRPVASQGGVETF